MKFGIITALLSAFLLCSCTTQYSSLKATDAGDIEVIMASESELLEAAYEAISNRFPTVGIHEISGYQTGFYWTYMPIAGSNNL